MLPSVADKEPSYWVKWGAGIAATVIGGVLIAVLAGAFKGDPPSGNTTPVPRPTPAAHIRITQFSTTDAQKGQYPDATFKVYNVGDDTADRCTIDWNPIGTDLDSELGARTFSDEFAVEPKSSVTLRLRANTPYTDGAGPYTAARAECANTKSEVVRDFIVIF
jgi:hypothetical protein